MRNIKIPLLLGCHLGHRVASAVFHTVVTILDCISTTLYPDPTHPPPQLKPLSEALDARLVLLLQDGNGYIDEQELDALLKDLYQKHKMVHYFVLTFKNNDFV